MMHQAEIQLRAEAAAYRLTTRFDHIYRVRFKIHNDWSGDPCVTFHIVLLDNVCGPDLLGVATSAISKYLQIHLHADEYGYYIYINYRSKTEFESMKDVEDW